MAPTTRGSVRASTSKVALKDTNGMADEDHHPEREATPPGSEDKVDTGIAAVEVRLKRDVADLQRKNKQLEEDLDEAREAADNLSRPKRGSRGGPSSKQLQAKVNTLRKQVADLEQERDRHRRKIEKLRAKEIKKDAEELQAEADFDIGDTAHKMRKLLRTFHDLMLAPSLEGDEECKICFEKLKSRNAMSFTCEHIFCKGCTQKLASGFEDTVRCPECRREVPKEEIEPVEYTASEQWDALLEVAKKWAKIDRRGELETSDEEQEEQFIDDECGASENRSVSSKAEHDTVQSETAETSSPPPIVGTGRLKRRTPARAPSVASSVPGEEEVTQEQEANDTGGRISTPPAAESSPQTPTYAESPASEKRRRMEELANSKQKRRRI